MQDFIEDENGISVFEQGINADICINNGWHWQVQISGPCGHVGIDMISLPKFIERLQSILEPHKEAWTQTGKTKIIIHKRNLNTTTNGQTK